MGVRVRKRSKVWRVVVFINHAGGESPERSAPVMLQGGSQEDRARIASNGSTFKNNSIVRLLPSKSMRKVAGGVRQHQPETATYDCYKKVSRSTSPVFGAAPIGEITREAVKEFLYVKRGSGLSLAPWSC